MSKYTYFSSFNTSFHFLIEKCLKYELKDVKITSLKQDIIVYESSVEPEIISNFPFFKDSYLYVKDVSEFKELYPLLSRPKIRVIGKGPGVKPGDYRDEVNSLASKVGLFVEFDNAHPDYELCLCKYNEFSEIGLKISRPNGWFKSIEEGSLDIDILYFLNYLSYPKQEDVVLDPFCGAGGIPIVRSQISRYSKIIAVDKNVDKISAKLKRLGIHISNLQVSASDVRSLKIIKDQSIDKIITDPPWGEAVKLEELNDLYIDSFNQFKRVLRAGGLIVLITSRSEIVLEILSQNNSELYLEKSYDVLVAGKKSTIHIIKKNA
jgi:predicted RNA methylase